jgi:hypothetical protein
MPKHTFTWDHEEILLTYIGEIMELSPDLKMEPSIWYGHTREGVFQITTVAIVHNNQERELIERCEKAAFRAASRRGVDLETQIVETRYDSNVIDVITEWERAW